METNPRLLEDARSLYQTAPNMDCRFCHCLCLIQQSTYWYRLELNSLRHETRLQKPHSETITKLLGDGLRALLKVSIN